MVYVQYVRDVWWVYVQWVVWKIQSTCAVGIMREIACIAVRCAFSRKRCARRDTSDCTILAIGPAGRVIGHGAGARNADLSGSSWLGRRGGSSIVVNLDWYVLGCTLRGPDSGRSNVRTFFVHIRESYSCSEFARVVVITDKKSSTLDWERERSFPVFRISGCRILSTESEYARSRWPDR